MWQQHYGDNYVSSKYVLKFGETGSVANNSTVDPVYISHSSLIHAFPFFYNYKDFFNVYL